MSALRLGGGRLSPDARTAGLIWARDWRLRNAAMFDAMDRAWMFLDSPTRVRVRQEA